MDISKALALINGVPQRTTQMENHRVVRYAAPAAIYLPRFCAEYDRPYVVICSMEQYKASRYLGAHEVIEAMYRQYVQQFDQRFFNTKDFPLITERCAICGSVYNRWIKCGGCHAIVCHARTTGNFFQCRDSCRFSGTLTTGHFDCGGYAK